MEYNRMLGEFIAQRRKALGITQKELAAKVGVSDKAVSKWETLDANPDISLLLPLSNILQVSVKELLKGEISKERDEQPVREQPEVETAQSGESLAREPKSAFKFALYLIASVLVGIVVVLLMLFVALAITETNENKIALVIVFTVLLLAFSALFLFMVKKTVQNAFARSAVPTETKK